MSELVLGGYGLTAASPEVRGRRSITLPLSIALHTAGAIALVVRAFLVEPLSVAPPPPPPPARAAAAPRVEPKPRPQQQAFVAPVEVPTEITPEDAIDLGGVDAGSADGVEGGVPGGVVGGIVGGLPDAPAPVVPVRVGGDVREPKRISAVQPVYPELAVRARLQGTVVVEATLNERGRVVNVSLVQGSPMLTESALEAVSKWVYSPTLVNGVPTPVIMTVKVHFRLNNPLG
jgi:protein TonB